MLFGIIQASFKHFSFLQKKEYGFPTVIFGTLEYLPYVIRWMWDEVMPATATSASAVITVLIFGAINWGRRKFYYNYYHFKYIFSLKSQWVNYFLSLRNSYLEAIDRLAICASMLKYTYGKTYRRAPALFLARSGEIVEFE